MSEGFLALLDSGSYQKYNRDIARALDSVNAAIMLSELVNRYRLHQKEGKLVYVDGIQEPGFYYTVEKCTERTVLSRKEQESAVKILESHGLFTKKSLGIPPHRHFFLKIEKIKDFVSSLNELFITPKKGDMDDQKNVYITPKKGDMNGPKRAECNVQKGRLYIDQDPKEDLYEDIVSGAHKRAREDSDTLTFSTSEKQEPERRPPRGKTAAVQVESVVAAPLPLQPPVPNAPRQAVGADQLVATQVMRPAPRPVPAALEFVSKLSPEQREVHAEITRFKPQHGDCVKSENICGWMLATPVAGKQGPFSSIQVCDAFMVYKQDAADAQNRGEKIESMGAYMRAALEQGRKPRNTDFDFNRQHAERASKLHPFLEVTKKYVKLLIGDSREEIDFDQPKSQFMRHFDQKVQTAMVYS